MTSFFSISYDVNDEVHLFFLSLGISRMESDWVWTSRGKITKGTDWYYSFSESYCQARFSPFSRVQSLIFCCGKSAGSVPERLMVVKPKFLRTRFLFSRDKLKRHNTARSYNSIITFWNKRLLIDVSINLIFCDSLVTLLLVACLTASGVMWPAHPPVSFFIVGNFLWKFVDILKNEEKISVTTDSYASKTNTIPAAYIK